MYGCKRSRRWTAGIVAAAAIGLVGSACSSAAGKAGTPAAAAAETAATTATTMAPMTTTTDEAYGSTPPTTAPSVNAIAGELAKARAATARYATDLDAAKADGYRIITPMMTDMGYHFLNPSVQGFDVEKPPILVYERTGDAWQLAALEWIFPEQPATPPLDGASYGRSARPATTTTAPSCSTDAQASARRRSPDTGSPFVFWHPPLVTMHVWIWYPNPDGLFASMNPLIAPVRRSCPQATPATAPCSSAGTSRTAPEVDVGLADRGVHALADGPVAWVSKNEPIDRATESLPGAPSVQLRCNCVTGSLLVVTRAPRAAAARSDRIS